MKKLYFPFITILLLVHIPARPQSSFPEWAKGIVWYQIFPERFSNGDAGNDPNAEKVFVHRKKIPESWKITGWTNSWFAQDEWEKKLGGNFRDHLTSRRYGGDLQGIIDRLDYLKELGIGAIYLNPVFEAVSMHKYDGSSFHHIDINFGLEPENDSKIIESERPADHLNWKWTSADKLFLTLIEEVHKRNMKIIIDGVFNHTGTEFWAFKDIVKNGRASDYYDWYIVNSLDDPSTPENEFDYEGWWGIKSLPVFNRTIDDLATGPKAYIFNSTRKWMDPNNDGDPSDGIDGWRLDVAREVPLGFWKDWSKLVKSINTEAIIVGELWELSPDFISENGPFDALMNYNFAFAVNDCFIANKKKIKVSQFIDSLKMIDKNYPQRNLHLLQNLLDSHDTDRLSSMIENPDRHYDRDADERNQKYNPGKPSPASYDKQKLISAFQITYRGAPMIYYGDEVGMWGADDPHDRKPMVWGDLKYEDEIINEHSGFGEGYGVYTVEQNKELLEFYKKLIRMRNESPAIKQGKLEFIYHNDEQNSFVLKRSHLNEKVFAAFNCGTDSIKISLQDISDAKTSAYEFITEDTYELIDGYLEFSLAPNTVKIFQLAGNL